MTETPDRAQHRRIRVLPGKAISEWVDDLGEKALARFGVRLRDGVRLPPSMSTIRNVV